LNLELKGENLRIWLEVWHEQRHLARTDLLWLCNKVLGYRDVSREVHGPILDALQHFPGAREFHKTAEDYLAATRGKVLWEPLQSLESLAWNACHVADRQTIYLFPRGHLKSTAITIAHSIQWILNYPNVRILLTTATETLVTAFVIEIRQHFIQNEVLRQLFPELCPQAKEQGKVPELGNLSGFTVPGRDNTNKKLGPGGKEPTLLASTVGSAITGYHGDVLKCDDLVEKLNSSSQNGIDDVIRHFGSMGDLLEKYNSDDPERPLKGWVDVVGTPWDFSDLYQVIRNSEDERTIKGIPPAWNRVIRSAAPNWPAGPYLWPQRMGYKALKEIEDDPTKGPAQLSAQYLMNPIVAGQGLIDDLKRLRWMDELEVTQRVTGRTLRARMDLAGMDVNAKGSDNDYTALSVGCFVGDTLMLTYLRHGRPPAEDVVEWIFEVFAAYPQLAELIVEKASGASAVESWLKQQMSVRNIWLPVTFVGRTNRESKVTRIQGLRPWFMNQRIVLSSALNPYRTHIEGEIRGFPKFRHDDILDTWSDLMVDSRGQVTGEMVEQNTEVSTGHRLTGIDLLLARAEFEDLIGGGGYNSSTGFPL